MLYGTAKPPFGPGDPVPWFFARASNNERFAFNSVAGRYLLLCFCGTGSVTQSAPLRYIATALGRYLDDTHLACFAVATDPADEARIGAIPPVTGLRYFWDFDGAVSQLYGAVGDQAGFTLVLDPALRTVAQLPHGPTHDQQLLALVQSLVRKTITSPSHAPVLIVPRVFEPEFCRELIDLYTTNGGTDSGYMQEKEGKTLRVVRHDFKRRRDFVFDEQPEYADLRKRAFTKIGGRLLPEIAKALQFQVTRIERFIVACYDAKTGGYFKPHRDNTTKGTAHRRFACTLNLNAEEYDGGELRFPEYGSATHRAPTGGAVIFSCSLLHEATPVTRGTRYAFLPFFYDEVGEKIRQTNRHFIE